jgi:hypothetical protein
MYKRLQNRWPPYLAGRRKGGSGAIVEEFQEDVDSPVSGGQQPAGPGRPGGPFLWPSLPKNESHRHYRHQRQNHHHLYDQCGAGKPRPENGLIGTVIVKVGDTFTPAALTTPESLDLHHIFAQAVEQGVSHVSMECSSSGLELYRIGSVDFDIVGINNISREHIDLHGSFDNYFAAKARLVREAGPGQWAFFNLDCPYSASLVTKPWPRPVTYGLKETGGDFVVRDLDLSTGRAVFTVELTKTCGWKKPSTHRSSLKSSSRSWALHSVYNAMAAIICRACSARCRLR